MTVVPLPASTVVGVAVFTTANVAAPVTVVGVDTVTVHPPVVVQPGPVHVAVLVITVPAVAVEASAAWKVRSTVVPAVKPPAMVQVMVDPDTETEQAGVVVAPSVPQLADPATKVVPAGAASVTTTDADVDAVDVFSTANV